MSGMRKSLWFLSMRLTIKRAMIHVMRIVFCWRHYHHYDDGRGQRQVYLNGKAVKYVKSCDTSKGWLEFYIQPIRVVGDEIPTAKMWGDVTVRYV